ncbi:hypothetical protein SAY87_018129 [Trapa incisa]|uniref:Histone-lysine N-methyltransferase ASHR3 n=1 Tax=Trapa incisa TaxID=236973 RepID=A0AAN7L1X4_9MYRT|nr:hypothetical protein SAY87_018129 [Trapa incisa]
MPDLGNPSFLPSSLNLSRCSHPRPLESVPGFPSLVKTLALAPPECYRNGHGSCVSRNGGTEGATNGKGLADKRKMEATELQTWPALPFLVAAKKMEKCLICNHFINHSEEIRCTVHGCKRTYHLECARESSATATTKNFKCPQHVCFLCKQRPNWQCVRCPIASHDKCAAWPDKVVHLKNLPRQAICWRHSPDWRFIDKPAVSATDIEEIFGRLPLPYDEEEFKLNITLRDMIENKLEPPPYMHIRRNVYLVKKKREHGNDGIGCTTCSSSCNDNCVCRVQCISCSKACHCPETCSNRPFRKEKKIKVVKTELCGWGVEAIEPINKGDFIVEYIGEVIDDALCEKRLWDMKHRGETNFYMCEIRKDFTIDATFKGNSSRFLNHSCYPNCFLEKWQVEGETRVGVFAARSIKVGEPLTYDYRFVQFGPEVKCHCGATNCQGYLGTKRKIAKLEICWGSKRKRTSAACVTVLTE